jgi:phosphatidylserine/phosphatidylglycerophosphate/cardiolipin synthase-like enzyme
MATIRFLHSIKPAVFIILVLLSALVTGCEPEDALWLEPVPSSTTSGYSSSDQVIRVYFTAPANDDFKGGPDQPLVEAIDQARSQVDAALYDLNLWSIRNALIRAHQRGIIVRLVVEDDSLDRGEIQELIAAGIPLVADHAEGLMHNKFLIIDQSEVWTGSMNFTVNGAYRHLNNLVSIRSRRVAENFQVEFDEMFQERYFGEISLENTPHTALNINDIGIETYFSPDDSPAERIIDLILAAEDNIAFMYYSFTSDGIADALIYQANQGLQIQGVLDAYQERTGLGGEYQRFRELGMDVFLDGHPEKMHHKVMVIDGEIVITGSYNLTRSAELYNDENVLVIHDRQVAEVFLAEFDWIYQDSKIY